MENQDNSNVKDLLMEDFRYIGETLRKNEDLGESRIKFLTGLVTAIISGQVILITSDFIKFNPNNGSIIIVIILFSLFSLLFIGIITLFRIINRNKITDGLKQNMDDIRQRFADLFDIENKLHHYKPFGKQFTGVLQSRKSKKIKVRKLGGLSHMAAAINSIIISAITGLCFFKSVFIAISLNLCNHPIKPEYNSMIICVIVAFFVTFLLQYIYIIYMDNKNKQEIESLHYTHAGGIVVKHENHEPKYLLVTAKKKDEKESDKWVFPKGHIEKGENHKDSAIREIWEETGVFANIIQPIGEMFLHNNGKPVNTKLYLMEYISQFDERAKIENREIIWLNYEEANKILAFPESKDILFRAKNTIKLLNTDKS